MRIPYIDFSVVFTGANDWFVLDSVSFVRQRWFKYNYAFIRLLFRKIHSKMKDLNVNCYSRVTKIVLYRRYTS